ncbi:MAG: hypothetical protein WBP76_00090 [Leptotrichiaceae bacterium]|nr:hypothetical protein [Fusobacteriaceae bacterium]MBP7026994.1 hypothetical protein [Leptotrichiaceae bacterium]MBP9597507.1 hypothetical protein [Fusobacteriaceae bacterium]
MTKKILLVVFSLLFLMSCGGRTKAEKEFSKLMESYKKVDSSIIIPNENRTQAQAFYADLKYKINSVQKLEDEVVLNVTVQLPGMNETQDVTYSRVPKVNPSDIGWAIDPTVGNNADFIDLMNNSFAKYSGTAVTPTSQASTVQNAPQQTGNLLIENKVWGSFSEATNQIRYNMSNQGLSNTELVCANTYLNSRNATNLDIQCQLYNGNSYIIRIYGEDKINTIISKLNSGQREFNFPTTVWSAADNAYLYYKGN